MCPRSLGWRGGRRGRTGPGGTGASDEQDNILYILYSPSQVKLQQAGMALNYHDIVNCIGMFIRPTGFARGCSTNSVVSYKVMPGRAGRAQ